MNMKAFAGVARAPFLTLPVTLIAVGAGAAAYDGYFSWGRTLLALAGLVALHIAVNVFNEVSDMRTGIDLQTVRTPFSGGSGTLPSGAITTKSAFIFGLCAAAVGLAIGIWFLSRTGMILLPVMILGAVCVLFYNNIFTRLGLGELAAGLGLGGLAVAGAAIVQNGTLGPAAIAASLPATFMTFNLLLLNEFPDEEADRQGGRRHLVIRFGRKSAALIYALAALLTPIAILISVIISVLPIIALAAMIPSLLLIKPLRWAFQDSREAVPIPALASNVQWIHATNIALAVIFIIASL